MPDPDQPESEQPDTELPEPDMDEIERFWELARNQLRLNPLPGYFGTFSAEAITPPSWAFGDSPEMADELLELVLSGAKTGTASALWEYEVADDPLPQAGELSIILDGRAHPRALISTTSVEVRPFSEVDAEHARSEGEGDLSLEFWREAHRKYFDRNAPEGGSTPDDLDVVLERFDLIFPTQ